MEPFIVTTDFYTLIPWITSSWIILGLVAMIALSIALGWYVATKMGADKRGKLWFAFGWIPIFGLFIAAVAIATNTYYSSRNDLAAQVEREAKITVITLVRGNESVFIGRTENSDLVVCNLKSLNEGNRYTVTCTK